MVMSSPTASTGRSSRLAGSPTPGAGGNRTPMRAETLVTVAFVPAGQGTEIRLSHEGFPTPEDKEGHEEGWKICLERLVDLVSER